MVMYCSAYGCKNSARKGQKITFHLFPRDSNVRKLWLSFLKTPGHALSKNARLCSEHFQADDFVVNFGRRTLKSDAVPSLFTVTEQFRVKDYSTDRYKLTHTLSDDIDLFKIREHQQVYILSNPIQNSPISKINLDSDPLALDSISDCFNGHFQIQKYDPLDFCPANGCISSSISRIPANCRKNIIEEFSQKI